MYFCFVRGGEGWGRLGEAEREGYRGSSYRSVRVGIFVFDVFLGLVLSFGEFWLLRGVDGVEFFARMFIIL